MPENTPSLTASDWMTTRGEKWRMNMLGMEAMLAPVDAPLLAALQLDAPYRIADIGCGGGRTALELLRQAPRGSTVVGLDISPAMIEAARARIPSGETALSFEQADVSSAPRPTQPFQRMSSRFGVMFFSDEARAFANLFDWLAPGARIAFAVWAPLAANPWLCNVREIVGQLVTLPTPDPDAPGPYRYAEVSKLLQLLRGAGFRDAQAQDWQGELPVGGRLSAPEAAQFALASLSSFAELLTAAGEQAQRTAQERLTRHFEPQQRDGAVWMSAHVHIVTALRP